MWDTTDQQRPSDADVGEPAVRSNELFLPPSPVSSPYRVLVLLAHRRNRTLLLDWFAGQSTYDAIDGMAILASEGRQSDPGGWADTDEDARTSDSALFADREHGEQHGHHGLESEAIDAVLVDVRALKAHEMWLRRRFELERPLPLPCLLLAAESTARQFFAPATSCEWRTLVDDIVTTPVDPFLLDRRLRAYLTHREMATELDRRHDQLSLLAQVVRHDIANAATVITGWGDLLRDGVKPEGMDALERVLRGGQRIREIVENSRDLTMLIDAGYDLEIEAVLLGPTLQVEVDTIRRVHSSTTKEVLVDLQSPLPTVEVVAGGMLPSVFANLLSNAVRHNDADTTEIRVTVETPSVEDVVVRVADNGPGIDDDHKEHVFEPSTKRGDSPGDGLGLSLVKRLVESYGGRVWFEDASGGGAVACVKLRCATPASKAGT